jgi:hypothetical protein
MVVLVVLGNGQDIAASSAPHMKESTTIALADVVDE